MSEFARDKENINGALLVNVTPEDFGGDGSPLAGIAFQRQLDSLFESSVVDITADIQAMEQMMASDGLTGKHS